MYPSSRRLVAAVQHTLRSLPTPTPVPAGGHLDEVGRLVRAGRLMEATAACRRGPGGGGPTAPRASGSLSRGSYGDGAAALAYRLHVPTTLTPGAGLVVMLHGGTQDADAFAGGTGMDGLAERAGFAVVYPEQSRSANAMGYWNWFRPGDQHRGAGEPALIAGITSTVTRAHDLDPTRVFVAGFSAGAAMAAVMAAAYPDLYAGAGVHSGLPHGAAHDVGSAFAAMNTGPATVGDAGPVPLVVVHGDQDRTVAPANADAVVRSALYSGTGRTSTEQGQVPGGRSWTRRRFTETSGRVRAESWTVHGLGHAWSGGPAGASYADPAGPDASAAMAAFFGLT